MPNTLLRLILLPALLAACSRNDAAARTPSRTVDTAATTTTTANGSVAPATVPRDSISDRADRGRIAGDSTAPVWLIMASDFQCPYCKQWHDAAFAGVMQDYVSKGRVRLAFLNMPLSMHQNALPAAEAAMCAAVQNKFWPMHEALFASQDKWETERNPVPMFESLATTAGVNVATYRLCMIQHLTRPLIEADRDRARQAGVKSTPTFFVGDKIFEGADKTAELRAALDAAIAKAGGGKKPTT